MTCAKTIVHIGLTLVFAALAGCSSTPEPEVADTGTFEDVFKETVARISTSNLDEAAWWFRPYYRRLLEMDHQYTALWIMRTHGRLFATRKLEPLLDKTEGRARRNAAVALCLFSYGLHPKAYTILTGLGQDDRYVGTARWELQKPGTQEMARKEAGVAKDEWKGMSRAQKWAKLKSSWAAEEGGKEEALESEPADAKRRPGDQAADER